MHMYRIVFALELTDVLHLVLFAGGAACYWVSLLVVRTGRRRCFIPRGVDIHCQLFPLASLHLERLFVFLHLDGVVEREIERG